MNDSTTKARLIEFLKWYFSKYWQVRTRRVFAQTVTFAFEYHIRGNFRGMKFPLNRKQTGFSRITGPSWKGSTCYVLLKICNCCKLADFHGLNFCCIRRWPWKSAKFTYRGNFRAYGSLFRWRHWMKSQPVTWLRLTLYRLWPHVNMCTAVSTWGMERTTE